MSPHGSPEPGIGVPRWARQRTAPVVRSNAYTLSFSVAAITEVPTTMGWPYTAPSTGAAHAARSAAGRGTPVPRPVRSLVPL